MHTDLTSIEVERIFLDVDNPRFTEGTCESESDAIKLLCKDEYVLGLARDVVSYGISPLEVLGVIKDRKPTTGISDQTYIVTEGNRRICALKLLHDPELAPADQKNAFRQLSEKWQAIERVSCTIFSNREEGALWLERLHGDLNGGIGRKKWTAEQKQRFSGDTRNARALRVLDYAQLKGFISEDQRKEKLTTAQRFLGNPILREALGIDDTNPNDVSLNRPKNDFDARLKRFVEDLIAGEKVHSRANKDHVIHYTRALSSDVKVSDDRIEPEPLFDITPTKKVEEKPKVSKKPRLAPKLRNIQHNQEITELLRQMVNTKLESLYFGICRIDLDDHFVPILTISCWAFIESLSAASGRTASTSFNSFYSNSKLNTLGLGASNKDTRPISDALSRLEGSGNTTKHHFVSAQFNGQQLANDMQCLDSLIVATCKDVLASKAK